MNVWCLFEWLKWMFEWRIESLNYLLNTISLSVSHMFVNQWLNDWMNACCLCAWLQECVINDSIKVWKTNWISFAFVASANNISLCEWYHWFYFICLYLFCGYHAGQWINDFKTEWITVVCVNDWNEWLHE